MNLLYIAQTDPVGTNVAALLGDGNAVLDGAGGWTVNQRPKWVGFTEWTGYEPYRMSIPLLFDGHAEDRSVETEIETLRQMMRPTDIPKNRAPIVRLMGHVPMTHLNWVIDGIDYGDEIRRADGARTRQFFTLKLLEYVGVDILVGGAIHSTPAGQVVEAVATPDPAPSEAPTGRTYTVKRGDTLGAISARELGTSNRWQEIASMNSIRDPRKLAVGTVLRLP